MPSVIWFRKDSGRRPAMFPSSFRDDNASLRALFFDPKALPNIQYTTDHQSPEVSPSQREAPQQAASSPTASTPPHARISTVPISSSELSSFVSLQGLFEKTIVDLGQGHSSARLHTSSIALFPPLIRAREPETISIPAPVLSPPTTNLSPATPEPPASKTIRVFESRVNDPRLPPSPPQTPILASADAILRPSRYAKLHHLSISTQSIDIAYRGDRTAAPNRQVSASEMASLAPSAAYRLTGQRSITQEQAREQQKIIEQKLSRANQPSPPYDFVDLIGKGTFGRVYLGMDIRNSQPVALKVMDADASDYTEATIQNRDQTIKDFQNEVGVLQKLKGLDVPNVNKIFDSFLVYDQLWIVTEYCAGGSVHTLMQAKNQILEERYVIPIIREVARGLVGIHNAGIIHRDLKAGNIMITDTGDVQVIDFGVAAELGGYKDKRTTVMGTLNWMAPEMHKRDISGLQYGFEVDIWSVGCLLYEMVKGKPPLAGKRPEMMSIELRRSPPRLSPDDGVSEELCGLAEFILQTKPGNRPTATEILDHPYLRGTEITHPTSILLDLVQDFSRWYSQGGVRQSLMLGHGAAAPQGLAMATPGDGDDDWRFSRAVDPEELQRLQQQLASNPSSRLSTSLRRTPSIKVDAAEDAALDLDSRYLLQPNVYTPGASPRTPSAAYQVSPPAMSPDDFQTSTAHINSMMDSDYDNSTKGKGHATEPINVDDRAAQRGGDQLASIFNENKRPYQYGDDPKHTVKSSSDRSLSDLPLRNGSNSADVRSKEVFAPDPNKPRLIAPGSIPDISSIDMSTIKQNRLASRSAGASPYASESSGDENYESGQEGAVKEKRDTMAWTPDWGNVEAPADDTYTDPDPFAQFGYQTSASSLAPPQRPGLTQSNTAPGEIPQVGSRASTATVMDLDALMGDMGTPAPLSANLSYNTSSLYPQSSSEPANSPAPTFPLPAPPLTESPEQSPVDVAPLTSTYRTSRTSRASHRRPSLGPIAPPSAESMADGAPSETVVAELSRLIRGIEGDLSDLEVEFEAAGALEGSGEEMEELGEEADEEGDGE